MNQLCAITVPSTSWLTFDGDDAGPNTLNNAGSMPATTRPNLPRLCTDIYPCERRHHQHVPMQDYNFGNPLALKQTSVYFICSAAHTHIANHGCQSKMSLLLQYRRWYRQSVARVLLCGSLRSVAWRSRHSSWLVVWLVV